MIQSRHPQRFSILFTISFLAIATACHRQTGIELVAGGLYTVESEPGKFGAAKLLAYEDGICHVRLYREEYPSRPATLDPGKLTLGGTGDKEGFSLGHVPLWEQSFRAWKPVLAGKAEVKEEELEGYRIWKKDGGGGAF